MRHNLFWLFHVWHYIGGRGGMASSGSVRASRPYSIFCSVDLSFESIRTNCKKHLALLDDAVFRMLDLLDLTAAMFADYELLTEQLRRGLCLLLEYTGGFHLDKNKTLLRLLTTLLSCASAARQPRLPETGNQDANGVAPESVHVWHQERTYSRCSAAVSTR